MDRGERRRSNQRHATSRSSRGSNPRFRTTSRQQRNGPRRRIEIVDLPPSNPVEVRVQQRRRAEEENLLHLPSTSQSTSVVPQMHMDAAMYGPGPSRAHPIDQSSTSRPTSQSRPRTASNPSRRVASAVSLISIETYRLYPQNIERPEEIHLWNRTSSERSPETDSNRQRRRFSRFHQTISRERPSREARSELREDEPIRESRETQIQQCSGDSRNVLHRRTPAQRRTAAGDFRREMHLRRRNRMRHRRYLRLQDRRRYGRASSTSSSPPLRMNFRHRRQRQHNEHRRQRERTPHRVFRSRSRRRRSRHDHRQRR